MFPKNGVISISNILNEILTDDNVTLMMMRIISWYLTIVNPKNIETKRRTIAVKDFANLFQVNINRQELKKTIKKLSAYEVVQRIGDEHVIIPFFSTCEMGINGIEEDIIILECSEEITDHIFDLKSEYLGYPAWNTILMKSVQTIRLYQILKQYRPIGTRTLSIIELKRMLGLKEQSYARNKDFYRFIVRENCKLINDTTDIWITYEIIGKKTKYIRFDIKDNPNRVDHEIVFLEKFARMVGDSDIEDESKEIYSFLSAACENKFNLEEMVALTNYARDFVQYTGKFSTYKLAMFSYLEKIYSVLKTKKDVRSEFGYMLYLIKNNI